MRALLITVLLALALAAVVAIAWTMSQGAGAGTAAPPGTNPSGPDIASPARAGGSDGPAALPEGTIATRTLAADLTPTDLADQPTAWLRVVDHDTDRPIAGAIVRRVQDGADLSFTDERGLSPLPLEKAAQLAVLVDGYLLRLVPTQPGSTEGEPQPVRMVVDAWSLRRQFAFVGPDGVAVDEAFVRLRPIGEPPAARSPVPADDAVRQRAWSEHSMLATRPVSRDVALQLASYNADRVHRLEGNGSVRFIAPGSYTLEVATKTGLVGRAEVQVAAGPQPAAQRVFLTAGAVVAGSVSDLDGQPLAGAELTVQGGEPLGLLTTTLADGSFAIGPLSAGEVTLLVRRARYQSIAHGPVPAPTEGVAIRLQPQAASTLLGRVRSRPALQPIAGATVIWQVARGETTLSTTAADGTFELEAVGKTASRLIVQAPSHITYIELVDPSAAFADYDLLPADTATRLASGLTATLEGVVFTADGRPVANASVRWRPAQPTPPPIGHMRRVLEGGTLQLPLVATTGDSGAFVLETTQFGAGRLTLAADDTKGVAVTAVAGKTVNGLRLEK